MLSCLYSVRDNRWSQDAGKNKKVVHKAQPSVTDVLITFFTYCVIYSNTEAMFCIIEIKKLSILMSPMCLSFNKSIVIQFIT